MGHEPALKEFSTVDVVVPQPTGLQLHSYLEVVLLVLESGRRFI